MGITKLLFRAAGMIELISITFCCQNSTRQNSLQQDITTNSHVVSSYTKKYKHAYNQGVEEALLEIKNNSMTFFTYGEEPDYPYNVETGLPAKIIAGCMIDDSIAGLADGHNQTIRNHLKSLIKDDEVQRATNHLDSTYSIEYRKAYYQGMQQAYTEIRNKKITRYVYGKGNWGDIDKETGVVIKVIAGCIVSDSIVGLADGHNYIILKYLNHEIK